MEISSIFTGLKVTPDFAAVRSASKRSFDSWNKRRPVTNGEGINLSGHYIRRSDIIEKLFAAVDSPLTNGCIFIRAPPRSGKTSMCQMCYDYFYDNFPHYLIFSVSCLDWPREGRECMSFEDGFCEVAGQDLQFSEIASSFPSKKCVLICDEAQLLYNKIPTSIWESIKRGLPSNVRIMLFSFYGESSTNPLDSTPYEFSRDQKFGLNDLLLTGDQIKEFLCLSELVDLNNAIDEPEDANADSSQFNEAKLANSEGEVDPLEEICRAITVATRGHVGLIAIMKDELFHQKKQVAQVGGHFSASSVLAYLMSHHLRVAIGNSRCIAAESIISLSDTVRDELLDLACSEDEANVEVFYEPVNHSNLVKSGILLVDDNGFVKFTMPIIKSVFLSQLRSLTLTSLPRMQYNMPTTVSEFVIDCLKHFSKDNLVNSVSISIGKRRGLIESKFQMEFYAVARRLLKSHLKIDPDVGSHFGGALAVDFYINGNTRWAIEFLVNSDRLNEHIGRFKLGGKYHKVIPFLQYIVVDFVAGLQGAETFLKGKYASSENYMRVFYSLDFESWIVFANGIRESFEL
jgi:hypothetical protein